MQHTPDHARNSPPAEKEDRSTVYRTTFQVLTSLEESLALTSLEDLDFDIPVPPLPPNHGVGSRPTQGISGSREMSISKHLFFKKKQRCKLISAKVLQSPQSAQTDVQS